MHHYDGKRQLETMLRSIGYGDAEFSITCLGGDISSIDRIELEICDERFDGAFHEIYEALTQSEKPEQVMEQLCSRGLTRRATDDG